MKKSDLIHILNIALVYVECCNEYSDDYLEEESNYRSLLEELKNKEVEDLSVYDIEVMIDACQNAFVELDMNLNGEAEEEIDEIMIIKNKLENLL